MVSVNSDPSLAKRHIMAMEVIGVYEGMWYAIFKRDRTSTCTSSLAVILFKNYEDGLKECVAKVGVHKYYTDPSLCGEERQPRDLRLQSIQIMM